MLTMMSAAIVAPSLPAISVHFRGIPNVEFLTKIILTTPAIVIAVTAPFVGTVSEKTGKIRLLLSAYLLYAVAGSAGLYINNLYFILISRMFFGLSVSVILTLTTTLIGDYFSGNERSKFISIQGSFVSAGGIVFITFAGFLADASWRYPFTMYLFPLLFIYRAYKYYFEPENTREDDILAGKSPQLLSNYTVAYVYMLAFAGMAIFYLIPVHLPFLIVHEMHENASVTGIAIAIMSISGATISWFYKNIKARFAFFTIFVFAFLLMGIGFAVVKLADNIVLLVAGLIIAGYGLGLLIPNCNLFFIEKASVARRTRLLGGLSSAFFLGQFASPLVSQPVFNQTGTRNGFLYFAVLSVVISLVIFVKKKMKQIVRPN